MRTHRLIPRFAAAALIAASALVSAMPAGADLGRSCWGRVTAAGDGQWARHRPVESGSLAFQLHAGQELEFSTRNYRVGDIVWRDTVPVSQGIALPMFIGNDSGGTRYIQIEVCDNGCGPRVCKLD
jgi:hypothetical protein